VNINDYTAYFHDGSIMNIRHVGNEAELAMSSAEIAEMDILPGDDVVLSTIYNDYECFEGLLHLEGIRSIKINGNSFHGALSMKQKYAGIHDFTIKGCTLELAISWEDIPPRSQTSDFSVIEIDAEKRWWEDIYNLHELYE
jgi:hypothetical protein